MSSVVGYCEARGRRREARVMLLSVMRRVALT
jgi:hypothetical protein